MKDIVRYLDTLKLYAESKLKEYFDIQKLNFDDFELVNSFLIYQSISQNKNLLILLPNKKSKTQFYIPVIITLSLFEFINNYIDNEIIYEVGDVLQKDGKRYKIIKIEGDFCTLRGSNNLTVYPSLKNVRKNYILTTAPLSAKKILIRFDIYKKFFIETLNLNSGKNDIEIPSKFNYKSVIVTDKKIVDELKNYQINSEKIHKAFPFRYISKSGTFIDNIPIDPMIYITNDYQTVKTNLLEEGVKIKNIIFIGANKYSGDLFNISNDLKNKLFNNAIFVGGSDMGEDTLPNLFKWKWSLPELNHFNFIEFKKINTILVSDNSLEDKLEAFHSTIESIENQFNIGLQFLYQYAKYILPVVIPNQESRLIKQLDNILDNFQKGASELVETEFFNIGMYDYEQYWEEIDLKYRELIECKRHDFSKFQLIQNIEKINYLVVPKVYAEIWKEEFKGIKNIISFNEYIEFKNNFRQNLYSKPNVVFLGYYGFNHLKEIIYCDFDITLLLYPVEEKYYKKHREELKKEAYIFITEQDRKKIAQISFKQTESEETISELLQRLSEKSKDHSLIEVDHSIRNENYSLNYEIIFENNEAVILDENKTILLQSDGSERPEKVKNLKENDIIRLYENTTKEELYKIAIESGDEEKFLEIESLSKLWKSLLSVYTFKFSSLTDFLKFLNEKGISISNENTLRNWITPESNVKFPQKTKDLYILKTILQDSMLDKYFQALLQSRRLYNGIMIALGRDLSDEVFDYIRTKKKGKILTQFTPEQITRIVDNNAPLRKIKTIKLSDDEQQ